MRDSSHYTSAFTLVEIMVVVAIIALLASIAVPNFLRARKRTQATRIREDLRIIESAIDRYAIENNKARNTRVGWTDIQAYLKKGSVLYNSGGADLFGNCFTDGSFSVASIPKLKPATFQNFSDVAPSDFWSPFYP